MREKYCSLAEKVRLISQANRACRLGHPSYSITQHVISQNNLPCSSESNKQSVCDACQKAKSHQLPYPKSTSISSAPLQLIFFLMFGVLLLIPLVEKNIMSALLTITTNLLGFIYLSINPRCFKNFMNFNSL